MGWTAKEESSRQKYPIFYSNAIRSTEGRPMTRNAQALTDEVVLPYNRQLFDLGCRRYKSKFRNRRFFEVMKLIDDLEKTGKVGVLGQSLKAVARSCNTYYEINRFCLELQQAQDYAILLKTFSMPPSITNINTLRSKNRLRAEKMLHQSLSQLQFFSAPTALRKNTIPHRPRSYHPFS